MRKPQSFAHIMSFNRIKKKYPLHVLVWFNDYKELEKALQSGEHDIEQKDPRGRTPIMLAVTLNHLESARILLRHGADVSVENREGYTVVHEAVSTENSQLLQEIIEKRDFQRYSSRSIGIPDLLSKMQSTPDFYVEIRWEFISWVPLVSRMCPSDVYKVYKHGSSVRIDTTLLGFYQSRWQRGNRSYIFKGHDDGGAVIMEVNHDSKKVFIEHMKTLPSHTMDLVVALSPSSEALTARFSAPIITTYVDSEKIKFDRLRSGIFSKRNSKSAVVNGYECKVYSASNVELITKTRTEHLTDPDKKKYKATRSPLQAFLGILEVDEKTFSSSTFSGDVSSQNPCQITPEEYFHEFLNLRGRDIGRPRETTTRIQRFKGNLWLCENYPISLQEQLIPIIDLMAISNRHFGKLRNFIAHQLPVGFPIKIEIPLFRVLHARVTFGNVFALDSPVMYVSPYKIDGCLACDIDSTCFDVPESYTKFGNVQAAKSVERPRTAESLAERRERRRQEIFAKYGISKSSSTTTATLSSSTIISPTATTSHQEHSSIAAVAGSSTTMQTPAVAAATGASNSAAAVVSPSADDSNAAPDGTNRPWRHVAKRIRSIFIKH